MKPTGDPDWFEHRAASPLTGREPLLGRLRQRLASREPGWGWITLLGPPGSGVTRLVEEAEAVARSEGTPFVLRLHPVGTNTAPPMEPLRRALARAFALQSNPQRLERALRSCFPEGTDEVGALSAWLVGGEGSVHMARPSPAHVRRFVQHLVRGGPVLVDDHEQMDEGTREVLRPSQEGEGFGVVAGSHAARADAVGDVWDVEPLSRSQIELLFKRWFKHTPTAKRLTTMLAEPCQGLAGRLVLAARELGREGALVTSARGVVLDRVPASWPDGRRDPHFLRRLTATDATARRVLEVVALLGGFERTDLVADAASVKPAVVDALRQELVAARGGSAPGLFFPSSTERDAHVARVSRARTSSVHARIAEAAERHARQHGLAVPALHAVLHRLHGGEGVLEEVAQALERVVRQAPAAHMVQTWVLDLLGTAVERLGQQPRPELEPVIARTLMLLDQAGRGPRQGALLRLLGERVQRVTPSGLWIAARAAEDRGRRDEAMALLAAHLPAISVGDDHAGAFDAWAQLARWQYEASDVEAACASGTRALAHLDPADLHRRAMWHGGMSVIARDRGRLGAAIGHGRRCVGMLRALGYLRPAGAALLRLGSFEADRGHSYEALDALARAAHLYQVVADAEGEAQALFAMGQVQARCQAYEAAANHLERSLAVVEQGGLERLRVPLHLALSQAHRGRGALDAERRHAGHAVQHATAALARLRAAAALAEADLRSGAPGAEWLLERSEQDLRAAGLTREADVARAILAEARLRAGAPDEARRLLAEADEHVPEVRLTQARLDRAAGHDRRALSLLEGLAADTNLPVDLRAAAHIHAAATWLHGGSLREAQRAATAGAALLEVMQRSRAHDARLHGILSRVFAQVGETGRAAGHRHLSRRGMRRLVEAAADPDEARRMVRLHWQGDARPSLRVTA
ncbi:MAG: hypothetical protein AB7T63_04675 [Planctomycetota bacterium]